MSTVQRIVRFAGVSGLGVCIDFVIYTLLNRAGLDAGVANVFSSSCGVTFVFVVSVRHVFEDGRGFQVRLFALYAIWQVISIATASAIVHGLDDLLDGAYIAAKLLVLPLTFATNYLFMSWLLRHRGAASGSPAGHN